MFCPNTAQETEAVQRVLAAIHGEEKARKGAVCLLHTTHHFSSKDVTFQKVHAYFIFQHLQSHSELQHCCYSTA